jgi:ABC-type glycerol-3-phosphate transport system permease component
MSLLADRRLSPGTLSYGGRLPVSQAVFYGALAVFALVWFAPVFILVFTSLKSAADFAHGDTFALPKKLAACRT